MKGKAGAIRWILILVIAAAVYWKRGEFTFDSQEGNRYQPPAVNGSQGSPERVLGYDKFANATLVESEGNDGDSFMVEADGREFELRLYFVDAPEKYYSDRYENQQRRVEEQAREMGGLSVDEIVSVGNDAKAFTLSQLKNREFTVFTYWEQVYDGDRYYGFVELPDGSYLGTRLVEKGLARIHTKGPGSKENPVPTPQGNSFHQHRDRLYALEKAARAAGRGAWGK